MNDDPAPSRSEIDAGRSDDEEKVVCEQRGAVLIIRINRPGARNAVDAEVSARLAAAMDRLDSDGSLRVGILTGSGSHFCAGMDLKAFLRGEFPDFEGRGFAGMTKRPPRKPLIAAVEGFALAGGFELVLACDLVVASEQARFGLPEVARGLAAVGGGLVRLPRRIPANIAMELLLTGAVLEAPRAHELGLVNIVAPPGDALNSAIELAGRLVENAPLAVEMSKAVVVNADRLNELDAFAMQHRFTDPVFASDDAREGAASFAEKRPARWSGT